jgi:hypothetical protein
VKKIFFTLLFLIFAVPCLAENKILINEFLIDPQPQQVEIFNSGTESADISNWIIDDSGGTTFYTIPQSSIIFPNSCLIFSGDFNLNKSSADTVKLIDNNQKLIDSFSYKSSSGSGITYFRFPDNDSNWATGSASLGFFNKTNNSCLITPIPTLMPTETLVLMITPTITLIPTEGQTPTSIPISYNNIYISEAMVYPQSGNNEWVEIFNNNDYSVSLNNWYIDDIENGGSTPKSFSADLPAKSYYVFNLSSSMFNNDGDSVRLLDNNKNLKDSFEYSGGDQGKTFGRTSLDNDDFCQQEPSSGLINNSCINTSITIVSTTETIHLSPTITRNISLLPTKPVAINQIINTKKSIIPTPTTKPGEVLGTSNNLLMNSPNNKSLVNTLLFISCSYSLLTIVSILIKMRIIYAKNIKLLSSSVYPS